MRDRKPEPLWWLSKHKCRKCKGSGAVTVFSSGVKTMKLCECEAGKEVGRDLYETKNGKDDRQLSE